MDLTDDLSVRRAFDLVRPDAVVALAAYGTGTDGLAHGAAADPPRAVDVNVRGMAVLAGECRRVNCGTLVLASSTTVYGPAAAYEGNSQANDEGDDEGDRVAENVPLWPATAYGATKAAAEAVTLALAEGYGLRAAAVRLPLVYGAGRWYGGSQRGLVDFARAVADGRPAAIRAWTGLADWMHVDDAASVLLAAALAGPVHGAYNVVGHTGGLADLAEAIAAHARAETRVDRVDAPGPDLPLADDSRLRADLSFVPAHATPESGAAAYVHELRRSR